MKNPMEQSAISRSQSELNNSTGKNQLIHGTTTKLDSLFRVYDQVAIKSYFPNFVYLIATVYIYFQIFVTSLYPFNDYWTKVISDKTLTSSNSHIANIIKYFECIAFFFHIENDKKEINLVTASILLCATFAFSIFAISSEVLGAFRLHTLRKISYYTLRLGFTILSPTILIPISAFFGVSIRNLGSNGSSINWVFMFLGAIMYFIFIVYSYIGLIVLNQSTCITRTPLSSFDIQIPLLLEVIGSFCIISQSIFSLFHGWAMVIVQLAHIPVSVIAFWKIFYLIFHSNSANIMIIGVTVSTWVNDVIFSILYFFSHSSKSTNSSFHIFYLLGLILPFLSLVCSLVGAYFFVTIRTKQIVKELMQLSEDINDQNDVLTSTTVNNINTNSNDNSVFSNHKLFKTQNMALMSIHIAFLNCLPLFYKWTAINFTVSRFPSIEVLMQCIQYLSFFPGTTRKLNTFLTHISQNRGLNYHQRFLLYEVYRIKMMRQSSVSNDANRLLSDLKNLSTQAYEDVYCFWNSKNASSTYLEMISTETFKIGNKWEEAIRDFPNYQKFSDEYCTFLIECQMDLELALVMKHRSNLIEMGRNFTDDSPFKSFARNFPAYLENGIVDFNGSFKNRTKEPVNNSANTSTASTTKTQTIGENSGSADFSGQFSSSSMLSSFNLDPEFEESIGRQLFKQTPLRLEMHRALSTRKSFASNLLLFSALSSLICGTIVFTVIYVHMNNYLIQRSDSMYYLNLASKSRFYLNVAILGSTLKFAYFSNRFTSLDFYNQLDVKDGDEYNTGSSYDPRMLAINEQISQTIIHDNNIVSRSSFEQLLVDLVLLGEKEKSSIYDFGYILMADVVPFYSCHDGIPSQPHTLTMKEVIVYMNFLIDQSAAKNVEEGYWYNSNEICELLTNQPQFSNSYLYLFQTLMEYEVNVSDTKERVINLLSYTMPFIPVVFGLLPTLVFTELFIKDANKLVNILSSVSQEAKDQAKNPIRKDSVIEMVQPSEKRPKSKHWIILRIVLSFFLLLNSFILYFMLSETGELNESVKKLGRWNLLASIRMASSVETMNYILNAAILNGSSSLNLTVSDREIATRKNMITFAKSSLVQLRNANEALLKGNDLVGPSSGYDKQLDKINTEVSCDVTNNNTDMHDSYRCSSASQGIGIFAAMIESIIENIDLMDGNFENQKIPHALHLLNRHLLEKLELAVDRIHDINVNVCDKLKSKALVTFIFGIIATILAFVVTILFYIKSVITYNAGMFLAQRLPPFIFFSNKKLHNFVMSKKELKEETEMSISQSVLFMSLDAIVCTNDSGVVEIINPAVTETLGYTPEQMLGQNISAFFVNSTVEPSTNDKKEESNQNSVSASCLGDSEKISNQLELMKNGQIALVYEDHFTCMTDDNQEMPCGVTILGMSSQGHTLSGNETHHNLKVESFVFIIRDETQLMQQQKAAEAAKAQSENLLFQILPRDIVTRLNSGEKDISFTVQSASVIFTDIVKFSEYTQGLSPQEIMGSLSTLFAAFDSCAKKYDLITKIKLIGDIYMAAGGLFADENVPMKAHAEQILNFGLDCLSELDEVNIKLSANLQLRVGINSGGPILAGVLGTDKPVFDIIGDPINVAARLQTTDIPGKAQIPKATYDLICDGDFRIEERGEVFLKGKGKTMTYLVSPASNANIFVNPSSSIPIL